MEMEFKEQIEIIFNYMNKNNLSQDKMAKKLGISRQYLNLILNGNKPITPKLALELESETYYSHQFWLGQLSESENIKNGNDIFRLWKERGYRTLVDHEIKIAVKKNYLKINPFDLRNLLPTSYTLTIGNKLLLSHEEEPIRLSEEDSEIKLQPNNKVAILTKEYLSIPRNISAVLSPSTKIIDKAISIQNGGKVHPGYNGLIIFIVTNNSESSIQLQYGSPILHIEFKFLPITPEKIYTGDKQGLNDFPQELKKSFYNAVHERQHRHENSLIGDLGQLLDKHNNINSTDENDKRLMADLKDLIANYESQYNQR